MLNKKIVLLSTIALSTILLSSCMDKSEKVMIDDNKKVEHSVMVDEKMSDDKMEKEEVMKKASGLYSEYSADKLANASGNIVLFFHASWCPSCKTADKNLSSNVIPEGLTVLKLDYDSSSDLKKKYGVTSQHTFVQIDNEGNILNKWSGGRNIEDVVGKLK